MDFQLKPKVVPMIALLCPDCYFHVLKSQIMLRIKNPLVAIYATLRPSRYVQAMILSL